MSEDVDHPDYYGGDDLYEVIKVLEAWDLELAKGFCWGNLIKYTARAGKKGSEVTDRHKAEWYANRLVTITATLEGQKANPAVGRRVKPYTAVLGDELADGDMVQDSDGDGWVKAGGTWSVIDHDCTNPAHANRPFTGVLSEYGPLTVISGQYKGKVFPKP
jgi:hypothetical protein